MTIALPFQMTIDISSTLIEVWYSFENTFLVLVQVLGLDFCQCRYFDNWCVCPFWSLPISSVALDQEKQSLLFQCFVYDRRCFLEYLEIFFL